MSYTEYMNKYINTLKTGELLVDLTAHDIYVTEEGYNIPIPVTKGLRDNVINFLENDIAGIDLRKSQIPGSIQNLFDIKYQIEDAQNELYDRSKKLDNVELDFSNKQIYLTKVNDKNVNQLGDLKFSTDNILGIDYVGEINSLVNQFNVLNNNSLSGTFSSDAVSKNSQLISIWNQITYLMELVNQKLDSMGSFSGNIKLKRNATRTTDAYDFTYSRRLYNWSNWSTITSAAQMVSVSQAIRPNFISWFKGNAYQDIPMSGMMEDNIRGTGFMYKNFPNKVDIQTGTTYARRYYNWDLLESIPEATYNNAPAAWSIGYLRSPTNNLLPDLWGQGKYANSTTFSHRYEFERSSVDVSRFGYGGDSWRQAFSMGGNTTAYTSDALLNLISYIADGYGMQRHPFSVKWNSIDGAVSNAVPIIPTITREIPYVSSTGIRNNDGMIVRMGIQKKVTETELAYDSYLFNNTTGWNRS